MLAEHYIPPRNAVAELLKSTPSALHDAIVREAKKIDKVSYTDTSDDGAVWPNAPYHYGMGRIKAYEDWLARLSENERNAEIAACRNRYEAHYKTVADVLIARMKELDHDLEIPLPQPERKRERKRERGLEL
jgi:hypothetical protein